MPCIQVTFAALPLKKTDVEAPHQIHTAKTAAILESEAEKQLFEPLQGEKIQLKYAPLLLQL